MHPYKYLLRRINIVKISVLQVNEIQNIKFLFAKNN